MNANEKNRNGHGSMNTTPVAESSEPAVSQGPIRAPEPIDGAEKAEPVTRPQSREARLIRRRRRGLRDSGAFSGMRSTVKYSGAPDMRVARTISRMRSSRRTWQKRWNALHAGFTRRTRWQSRSGRRLSSRSWTNCKSIRRQPFQGSNHWKNLVARLEEEAARSVA